MNCSRYGLVLSFFTPFATLFGTNTFAGIMGVTGAVEIVAAPPSDLRLGTWESNTAVRVFGERQNLALSNPLAVDITVPGTSGQSPNANVSPGTVLMGTRIDSFYLHFDNIGEGNIRLAGSITFDSPILGILVGLEGGVVTGSPNNSLGTTNGVLGLPGLTYGYEGIDLFNISDQLTLGTNLRTISFNFGTALSADNMRIVTATSSVPKPSSIFLVATFVVFTIDHRRTRRTIPR